VKVADLHPWPTEASEAETIQERLRPLADLTSPGPAAVRTVAGLDVAHADDRLAAAAVVLDAESLDVVEEATVLDRPGFPYVPGLFAFRELPALVGALRRLSHPGPAGLRRARARAPEAVRARLPPRRADRAALDRRGQDPAGRLLRRAGTDRGAWSAVSDDGQVVGRALRTQTGVRPVFVSVGHRADLDTACALTLRLAPRHRLPETTRRADHLSRKTLTAR
jgi:deoxyribonuclease V